MLVQPSPSLWLAGHFSRREYRCQPGLHRPGCGGSTPPSRRVRVASIAAMQRSLKPQSTGQHVLHRLGEGGLSTNRVPSYGWQAMFYTYVIESLSHPDQRYIGHTADLRQRVADHNAGKCPYTSKFVPWKI